MLAQTGRMDPPDDLFNPDRPSDEQLALRPRLTSDAAVSELLDLLIPPLERRRRVLWLVLCEGQLPLQPCAVDLPDEGFPPEEDLRVYLAPFAEALRGVPDGGLLVALTRPGSATVRLADRLWFHAVHAVARRADIAVVGVWVVTPVGERAVQLDDAA